MPPITVDSIMREALGENYRPDLMRRPETPAPPDPLAGLAATESDSETETKVDPRAIALRRRALEALAHRGSGGAGTEALARVGGRSASAADGASGSAARPGFWQQLSTAYFDRERARLGLPSRAEVAADRLKAEESRAKAASDLETAALRRRQIEAILGESMRKRAQERLDAQRAADEANLATEQGAYSESDPAYQAPVEAPGGGPPSDADVAARLERAGATPAAARALVSHANVSPEARAGRTPVARLAEQEDESGAFLPERRVPLSTREMAAQAKREAELEKFRSTLAGKTVAPGSTVLGPGGAPFYTAPKPVEKPAAETPVWVTDTRSGNRVRVTPTELDAAPRGRFTDVRPAPPRTPISAANRAAAAEEAMRVLGTDKDKGGDTIWALLPGLTMPGPAAIAGPVGKVAGWSAGVSNALGLAPDVDVYQSQVEGFMPLFARAVGHTGVLTEKDVARTERLFPRVGDTRQVAERKLRRIEAIIGGKEAVPAGLFDPQPGVWPPEGAAGTPDLSPDEESLLSGFGY
jgi:hypothetical protein